MRELPVHDVMIDLETLGTSADSVIMSIGAVKFDIDSNRIDDAAFYASISIESNLSAGRTLSESTLVWWLKQSVQAQEVFSEPKQELDAALVAFTDWWATGPRSTRVWSNGADFDIPMMAHAFSQFGLSAPWDFWNARCVRTYKNLPGAKNVSVPNTGKHNALSDAIAQTHLVQAIQKKLSAGHSMVKS